MKITFLFDDGTEAVLKPEGLSLANSNDGKLIALTTKIGEAIVPLLTFKGQVASEEVPCKGCKEDKPETASA